MAVNNMGLAVNNMEKIKSEKDGLDVIRDISRYAREGFETIPADDFDRLAMIAVSTVMSL